MTFVDRCLAVPRSRIGTLLLGAAAGALMGTAFPDLGWWPAAPVAVGLLLIAARRTSGWWNLLVGWVSGMVFFLTELEFVQFAVGPVPWLLLSAAEALAFGLMLLAWTWLRSARVFAHHSWLAVPVIATLWTGLEELRSVAPFGGFPWGRLAFSQSMSPLGHLAWLGGAPVVSWATCASGVCLLLALAPRRWWILPAASPQRTDRGRLWARGMAALLAVGVALSGLFVPLTAAAEAGELRVGAVQGDVSEPGLHAFDHRREVLNNHLRGTAALADDIDQHPVDVVLWPENGTDIDPTVNASAWHDIDDASRAVNAPILVGTVQYPATGGRYNVGMLWQPGIGPTSSYTKQHPVPFAEYIPMRSFARFFSSAVDLVRTDMRPGDQPGVLDLPNERLGHSVPLGDVICFEVAIDGIVRDTVASGAQLLVVQTNNASFGFTTESTQQRAMTRLRAIETGRAAVQISTVGVSAIIGPDGTTLDSSGLFVPAQLRATVPLRTSLTPAVRWGGEIVAVISLLAALLGAGALGSRLVSVRRRRRATPPVVNEERG